PRESVAITSTCTTRVSARMTGVFSGGAVWAATGTIAAAHKSHRTAPEIRFKSVNYTPGNRAAIVDRANCPMVSNRYDRSPAPGLDASPTRVSTPIAYRAPAPEGRPQPGPT